jgi:transposase
MSEEQVTNDVVFDHYIAVDWSAKNMAIARMTKKSNKITTIDVPSDVGELQVYLKSLEGSKILTIEETTTSQWLYTELKDHVNKIIVCDPNRNRLLSEGPKTDKIDATKLVRLLKAGLMKEVFHSGDKFLYMRRIVSGYDDLVKAGVRLKNQRYSLLRICGKDGYETVNVKLDRSSEQHVLESLDRQITAYETEKRGYEKEFIRLSREHVEIRYQSDLPGIGRINAVKIVARVVAPYRFVDDGHYWSYCGLIKLDRVSGGVLYGRKNPRYCRQLKGVYKTAALVAIGGDNEIRDYYEHLIKEKGYAPHNARNKVARRLATLSLGVFKSQKQYEPYNERHLMDRENN